ncbi:MAG: hypothetical protein QJR12_14255 [Mycobacterium sp.]|uniref:hypothetical protein n=1 Tax=Mycobacterium sp. TaxID=1785 RepID=UPI00262E2D99|nr:hypothetical protein [Mycobacterium sp.]MDI3315382.1 hypothetical protein [Mycobacterium sp.]
MPPRQRPLEARGVDTGDTAEAAADAHAPHPDGEAAVAIAAAEQEAARAEARAAAARARALRLREHAEASLRHRRGAAGRDGAADTAVDESRSPRFGPQRPRLRLPGRTAVPVGVALVLMCASLGASAAMVWHHRTLVHNRERAAQFAAAARAGALTLMSIDAAHAKEDFQRIIDNSTGELKNQLEVTALYLAKGVADSKVSTKATVEAVAVESMTDDSAVVLIAAKSDTTNPDNTKRPPALWRLSISVTRDGGRLKMSKVEFVP